MRLAIKSLELPSNPSQRMGKVELRTSLFVLYDLVHLIGTIELIKVKENLFYISKSTYYRWGASCYSNEVVPLR